VYESLREAPVIDASSGTEVEELVGQTIFQIVRPHDLAGLLWAFAQATSTSKGVALHIHINRAAGRARLCQMLLVPTDPFPRFAFALVSAERSEALPDWDLDALLAETRGTDVVGTSRDLADLTEAQVPGISELSPRELDVLTRLLAGHRVPAVPNSMTRCWDCAGSGAGGDRRRR
jgi:hypothetical protein